MLTGTVKHRSIAETKNTQQSIRATISTVWHCPEKCNRVPIKFEYSSAVRFINKEDLLASSRDPHTAASAKNLTAQKMQKGIFFALHEKAVIVTLPVEEIGTF